LWVIAVSSPFSIFPVIIAITGKRVVLSEMYERKESSAIIAAGLCFAKYFKKSPGS
jgi:hypothetical protein